VTKPPVNSPAEPKTSTISTSPGSTESLPSGTMGFFDHFEELRQRLFRSLIALVISMLLTAVFTTDIIKYLSRPYKHDLVILTPTGSVVMYFRVALMSGAILAIPYITYQLFMFVAPGLTKKEKKWVLLALPATTGFFLMGVAFSWFIMVPSAFDFLQTFQDEVFVDQWTAQEYFAFLTSLLFWIGVAFEMPVVLFVLARLGIIGPGVLIRNWRFAIVAITVIAAIITPTVDPFNMLLVMGPLILLYGISIVLVTLAARKSRQSLST
jgi:sec-independent protein translocase protein TatC